MHFQIFIPNAPDVSQSLVDVGLAHLAIGFDAMVSAGPDNSQGSLFAWRSPITREMGYYPQRQDWFPAVPADGLEAGRYWVGVWADSPPGPQHLQRPYPHAGEKLQLGDGCLWTIPRARDLPADVILADDGTLKFEQQRQYHAFTQRAAEYWELLRKLDPDAADGNPVEYTDLWAFVCQAMVINYRITPELISHLRLFTRDSLVKPLLAVVGAYDAARRQSGATSEAH